MSDRRIILAPREVVSSSDGERHYISAARLADLYRLTTEQRRRSLVLRPGIRVEPNDIVLEPRFDGDYQNPEVRDD